MAKKLNNNNANEKTLLIAEPAAAVFGYINLEKLSCKVCGNIIEAMNILTKENFDRIIIQLEKTDNKTYSAIEALKQIRPSVRIILLARIYQEPVAIELTARNGKGTPLADDYYICPISADFFEADILGVKKLGPASVVIAANADVEKRLRILEKLATEDDLTGLKNRRYLLAFLSQLMVRAERDLLRITLLVFDIDNFKSYNDSFGHPVGDKVLQQISRMIQKCIRKQDVVARIGGDEFAVVFWDSPSIRNSGVDDDRRVLHADHPRQVVKVAQRFRNEMNSGRWPSLGPNAEGQLTISGGLASYAKDGNTIKQLFEQADKALMRAKKQGKNQIYIVGQPENVLSS